MAQLDGHIDAQVDSRILGAYDANKKEVFSAYDPPLGTTTRNANCWLADVDLTGWARGSSFDVNNGGTLITRRHALTSDHLGGYSAGDDLYFIKADGTVVSAEIAAVADDADAGSDVRIVAFTADVDADIADYQVLPASYADQITVAGRAIVTLGGRNKRALVHEWLDVSEVLSYMRYGLRVPVDAQRLLYYELLDSGDSGHPAAVLINGELVLLGVAWFAKAGQFAPDSIAQLNTLIAEADTAAGDATGYTITTYPLSSPSPAIVNAGYHGLLGWIDGWFNVPESSTVPTMPGLEFTMPVNRMHHTIPESRMHHTMPENRMHHTIPEED